jgi:hypothetical protein
MTLIQRTLLNNLPLTILFLTILASIPPLSGQPITLTKTRLPLNGRPDYFLLDVVDKRKTKNNGIVITNDGKQAVEFSGSTERSLYEFWKYAIHPPANDSIPIVANILELSLNEKTTTPGAVAGEISIHINFEWMRGETTVPLTGYKVKTSYTRPSGAPYNHAAILQRLLSDALVHFDKWMIANEGKNPALVRSVRLTFKEVTNQDSRDTVFYNPTRPLTWADFQANSANRSNRYAAGVFTSMSYEGNSKTSGKFLDVVLTVKTYMVKEMSWVKPNANTDYGLRHEQIHFDITRIMVEKFKERVRNIDLTVDDYDSLIQYQFLEAYRDMHREQEKYDKETNHGIDVGLQAKWDRETAKKIKELYKGQLPAN